MFCLWAWSNYSGEKGASILVNSYINLKFLFIFVNVIISLSNILLYIMNYNNNNFKKNY